MREADDKRNTFRMYAYGECTYTYTESSRHNVPSARFMYTYMPSLLYLPFGMKYFTKV